MYCQIVLNQKFFQHERFLSVTLRRKIWSFMIIFFALLQSVAIEQGRLWPRPWASQFISEFGPVLAEGRTRKPQEDSSTPNYVSLRLPFLLSKYFFIFIQRNFTQWVDVFLFWAKTCWWLEGSLRYLVSFLLKGATQWSNLMVSRTWGSLMADPQVLSQLTQPFTLLRKVTCSFPCMHFSAVTLKPQCLNHLDTTPFFTTSSYCMAFCIHILYLSVSTGPKVYASQNI